MCFQKIAVLKTLIKCIGLKYSERAVHQCRIKFDCFSTNSYKTWYLAIYNLQFIIHELIISVLVLVVHILCHLLLRKKKFQKNHCFESRIAVWRQQMARAKTLDKILSISATIFSQDWYYISIQMLSMNI